MMNKLLARQLKKYMGEAAAPPEEFRLLLQAVSDSYDYYEEDRALIERSLEVSSRELSQANSDLRFVFRLFPDIFLKITPAGKIVDCNVEKSSFFFMDPSQLMGQMITEIVNEKIGALFEKALTSVKESRTKTVFDYSLTVKGEKRHYEASFMPLSEEWVIAFIKDITERKIAEEALIEQYEIKNALLSSIPALVYFKDRNLIYIAANKSFADITGASVEQIQGKTDYDFFNLEDAMTYRRADRYVIDHDEPIYNIEEPITAPDGRALTISTSKAPFHDSAGRVTGVVGISIDITEQKKLEELKKAKYEAEAANKAKSRFLATMSHEIRTPMNAIIGMTDMLMQSNLPLQQREFLSIIHSSGNELLKIINDVLDFAKIEASHLELEHCPLNLRNCVEDAIDMVSAIAGQKGIEILFSMEDNVPETILGDITRLRQVLINLLGNAVKFTEQGEIEIIIRSTSISDELYELLFTIRDTGVGIPPDRLHLLFNAFSQIDSSTTRHYGGTGLGLAISKKIVELMGGNIGVESTYSEGSRFFFTIRTAKSSESIDDRSGELVEAVNGKSVLIVDDNKRCIAILSKTLASWGMNFHSVISGEEALACLEDNTFDLALIDCQLACMDGISLARAIRVRNPQCTMPVVLMTSIGEVQENREELGIITTILKPVKNRHLKKALNKVFQDADKGPAPAAVSSAVKAPPPISMSILIVEDNQVNQKVASKLIEKVGFTADIASTGYEALKLMKRKEYDVVFMDIQMPGIDGFETTHIIRNEFPADRQPFIIAMTACAFKEDKEQCFKAGMDHYLPKPVDIRHLAEILNIPLSRKQKALNKTTLHK
ncbi:MAG: response regulator [Candidatus Xenobiia bacterium LiM19]